MDADIKRITREINEDTPGTLRRASLTFGLRMTSETEGTLPSFGAFRELCVYLGRGGDGNKGYIFTAYVCKRLKQGSMC